MPETNLTISNPETGEKKRFTVKSRWRWLHTLKYVWLACRVSPYVASLRKVFGKKAWQYDTVETTEWHIYSEWSRARQKRKAWKTKVKLLHKR